MTLKLPLGEPPPICTPDFQDWIEVLHKHLLRFYARAFNELGCGLALDAVNKMSVKLDGLKLTCSADGLTIGTFNLDDISDVSAASPSTNDIIYWDGSIWSKIPFLSAVGGTDLTDLGDVTVAHADNRIIRSVGGEWVHTTLPSLAGAVLDLEDLADVANMIKAANDIIIWNGTAWADTTLPALAAAVLAIGDLSNVTLTGVAVNDVLVWNGSAFINVNVTNVDHGIFAGLLDDDHTQYIRVDGTRAFTGDQSMGGKQITSLAAGTLANHAANVGQVPNASWERTWLVDSKTYQDIGTGTIAATDAKITDPTDYDGHIISLTWGPTTQEGWAFRFVVPGDLDVDAVVTITAYYGLSAGPTSTMAVEMAVSCRAVADNEALLDGGVLAEITSNKVVGSGGSGHAAGDLVVHAMGTLFSGGDLFAGDLVKGVVYRDADHADDTYATDIEFFGFSLKGTRKFIA